MPRDPNELRFRIALVNKFIDMLENDLYICNDSRAVGSIHHYKKQRTKLEQELAEAEKPKDIVIGLQPGSLSAKSPSIKE